jgi:hypothetical protein
MTDVSRTYRKNLVTYIDVLGFGDLIQLSRNDSLTVTKIAELLEQIKALSSLGQSRSAAERDKVRSFKFSDLLVRATEITTDLTKLVEMELFYLMTLQFSFVEGGVLIRGGICAGDLFVAEDNAVVFGPALVKSYKLESEYAVYPRILIDRDLHAQLVPNADRLGWAEFVSRGEDGAYFLDYLFARSLYPSPAAVLGATPEPQLVLEAHKNMILDVVKKIQENKEKRERVKQKYMWLALYHNRTIDRLRNRFGSPLSDEIDDFKIQDNFLIF